MERSFQEKSKLDSLLRVISLDVFALHRRFAIPSLHRSIPVAVRFTPGNQLRFLSALLLGLLIATLLLSLTRRLNADEFQLGILALEMNRGRALYSELWDNHGPSPAWLMAGVFQVWPFEDYRQWIGLRLGAFTISLVSAGFVWLSLCRLYRSRRLQLLGLLVYLAHPAVISVGYEVRSDLLLMVFWTASVFVWINWNTGKKQRSVWGEVFSGALSAVLLGLCFSTSLKSVFLCGALGLASLIITLKRPQHGWVFVGYAVGGVVGLLLWLAPLWWSNTLPHFWEQFVGKNIDRPSPPIFTGLSELFEWAPLSAFLLLSFSLLGFRLIPGTNSRSQLILSLWAVMLVLAGAFCFVLPTHHLQSLLTLAVPLALITPGLLLVLSRQSFLRVPRWILPISCGAVFLLAGFTTKDLFELHQQEQIREFNKLATAIPEGDAVFDGYGHPMTHPHPLYYTSWVATLQYRQNNGYLDWNPEEEFQKHNIRWVIRDNRIRKLEGEVDRVIREKYEPSGFMEYVWERQIK